MHRDTTISNELAELGRRLRDYREAHVPRRRLPEELWSAATAVARQEGLYRTARFLHLDYAQLKKRVEPFSERRVAAKQTASRRRKAAPPKKAKRAKRSSTPAAFVELLADSLATDCLIEVEGASGGRMRIRRKMSTPEVLHLVRDWRESLG